MNSHQRRKRRRAGGRAFARVLEEVAMSCAAAIAADLDSRRSLFPGAEYFQPISTKSSLHPSFGAVYVSLRDYRWLVDNEKGVVK